MTIVAFLQNMWVRHPERVKRAIEKDGEEFRLKFMRFALFRGCLTGRRLKAAFSEQLCDEIIWEETTREIAGDPKTIFPAQPEHIKDVLEKFQPDVVLTFGKIAEEAVKPLCSDKVICSPHPAARQPDTIQKLKNAAALVRNKLIYCPACNESLVHANLGDGTVDSYCEECGWPDEVRE